MNESMVLGILCGLLIGGIVVVIILKLTKEDGSVKCKYDERQQLVRGRGFKYGFFVLLIYNFLYGMADLAAERRYLDSGAAMTLGICVGVLVYAVYCIWNDGYFSLNENPRKVLIAFVFIGVFNLLLGLRQIKAGELIVNGMLTFRCTNLLCGAMFLVLFLVIFVKWICNKREKA